MPEFYMILVRKIIKIPEFLLHLPENLHNSQILYYFCPKNARILHKNCPKNIFPRIFFWEGASVTLCKRCFSLTNNAQSNEWRI